MMKSTHHARTQFYPDQTPGVQSMRYPKQCAKALKCTNAMKTSNVARTHRQASTTADAVGGKLKTDLPRGRTTILALSSLTGAHSSVYY